MRTVASPLVLALLLATAPATLAQNNAPPWLVRQQAADGSWPPGPGGSTVAVSALATLAFLESGHSHRHGRHKRTVERGLRYLVRRQRPDGRIGESARDLALGTLALAQAYEMTHSPWVRGAATRAAGCLRAQTETLEDWEALEGGGQRREGAVLWTVIALQRTRCYGLAVPELEKAFAAGRKLIDTRLADATRARPAADGLAWILLGQKRSDARLRALARRVNRGYRPMDALDRFATHAFMYQMGGDHWKRWNRRTQSQVLERQATRGPHAYSWAPAVARDIPEGRVGVTALNVLLLETYRAYPRVYR